jgi:3-hydroxyacyl-[acyl-carrier-protein] dehydratase
MTALLLDHFYKVDQIKTENDSISATVTFDIDHPIFKGHFPDMPIVPGVCQTQMLGEILNLALHQYLHLKSAASIKFLSVVDPTKNKALNVVITFTKIEGSQYNISAQYKWEDTVFFKFKGIYAAS